jgi:hypothetical protein
MGGSIGEAQRRKRKKMGEAPSLIVTKQRKSVSTFSPTVFSFSCSTDFVPKAFSASIFAAAAPVRSLDVRFAPARNKTTRTEMLVFVIFL